MNKRIDPMTALGNADLEAGFIGACLMGADHGNLARLVEPDCFQRPFWRACWAAIVTAWQRDEPPDPLTIAFRAARETGYSEDRAVQDVLAVLADPLSTGIYALPRARELRTLLLRRRLVSLGGEAAKEGVRADEPEAVARYVLRVAEELDEMGADEETGEIGPIIERLVQRADSGESHGMMTGLPIDEWCAGLHRSEIMVIAAPPGVGKTWMMLHAANTLADAGHRVAVFSLEMSPDDLTVRMLAGRIGRKAFRLRGQGAQWTADEYREFRAASEALEASPVRLFAGQRSMRSIAAAVRQYRPDVFCIDFVQLLERPRGADGRTEAAEMNCAEIMTLTKRADCAAIVLSQVSREVVRAGLASKVLGGQDSGRIDQMADVWLWMDADEMRLNSVKVTLRKARHAKGGQTAIYRLDGDSGRMVRT